MKFLLDTNVWISLLKNSSMRVVETLQGHAAEDIALCSVVLAELYFGANKSAEREFNLRLIEELTARFQSLPFDDRAAVVYGEIRADLARRGLPIGAHDYQIAAIAITNRLTLVTNNVREFSRVQGLVVIDWQS